MKKVLLTFVLLAGIASGLFAQKLTYQAVVRDNNQRLVTNTAVKATVTIDFATGEDPTWTVDATTNLHGLLTFEFGDGSLVGRDWTDATIAVRVVNAATPGTVYVNDAPRPVSAVPYALSVDGKSIQNYLDEKHYVDLAKLNDTLGAYPTTAAMDARHYLTSDSAAITTMKGNITANATNITSLQGNLSAAINKEKEDSTTLAGRIDALESASMDCNDVMNCIKDTLNSYTTTSDLTVLLQQLTARLDDQDTKIDSLAHMVDSLAKLIGGDTTEVADGEPCPGAATVTDIDGNTYNTVKIGNQCWMKENLRTTRYADGTSIELGTSTSSTKAYLYNPDGNSSNVSTYGYLYNWQAVMGNSASSEANPSGVQGICPNGWHVPSDAEWTQLTDYVSSQSEYVCGSDNTCIAKALASATGWTSDNNTCAVGNNPSANNATGFAAVPAGTYLGSYYDFGLVAYFWTATQDNGTYAYYRYLQYIRAEVVRLSSNKYSGFSVRCLRDPEAPAAMTVTTDSTNTVTGNSAKLYGNVTDMGGKTEVKAGFKYGTSEDALTSIAADESAMYGTGKFNYTITGLAANTQYYYKAFAANGTDTVYGEVKDFTTTGSSFTCGTSKVKDVDNNEYNTVKIGNQCWMKENLRTNVGGGVYPQNNGVTVTGADTVTYGRLYTWTAMMNGASSTNYPASGSKVQGICPTGWHVPSDAEWSQLATYVNKEENGYRCNGDGTIAKALSTTTGWSSSSDSGCNAGNSGEKSNLTGFSAVPAGICNGSYTNFGNDAHFWSATQYPGGTNAWNRSLGSDRSGVGGGGSNKAYGFSVRCLRDPE